MSNASVPSIHPSAVKAVRPSASASSPSEATFDAFLTAEMRQQDTASAAAQNASPDAVADGGKTAPGQEPKEAEKNDSVVETPASGTFAAPAVSPELLALMTSAEKLRNGTAGDTGVESEDATAIMEASMMGGFAGKRAQRKDAEFAAAMTFLPQDIEADASLTRTALSQATLALAPGNVTGNPASQSINDFAALLDPDAGTAISATSSGLPSGSLPLVSGSFQPVGTTAALAPGFAQLPQQVGSEGWDQALGNKLVWMAGNGGMQSASLSLNPPELGPLKIVVNVSNANQASASFISAQPEVRQAIESALPRLRDMMNEVGIQLGQATVDSGNQQSAPQGERRFGSVERNPAGHAAGSADLPDQDRPSLRIGRGTSLVDTFA